MNKTESTLGEMLTPETDGHIRRNTGNGTEWVRADFARNLERRLARAEEEREELRAIVAHVFCEGMGREFFPQNLDGTDNEWFDDARALLSRLRVEA